jgi:hypothetical protein
MQKADQAFLVEKSTIKLGCDGADGAECISKGRHFHMNHTAGTWPPASHLLLAARLLQESDEA